MPNINDFRKPAGLLTAFMLVFLWTACLSGQDQAQIDSLENRLEIGSLDDEERTRVLLELTRSYGYNDPETSIAYGKAALDLSRKTGDQVQEAIALRSIGVSHHFLDRYDIARQYYDSSLTVSVQAAYIDGQGASLYNMGSLYEYTGEYGRALEYYLKALELKDRTTDQRALIYIYSGIGNIYKYQRQYALALESFNNCLDLSEELDQKNEIAYSKYNLGLVYDDLLDYKQALSHFQESLEIRRAINDRNGAASSAQALGETYLKLYDYENALRHFREAFALATEIDNKWSLISSMLSLGDCYRVTGQQDRVLPYLDRALEMAMAINSKALIRNSYKSLSDYYESTGSEKAALDYFKLYAALKDSIYNEETSQQITAMQTLYETEQKDREIELQQARIEGNEAELRRRNIQRYGLLGGITLVVILMAVLHRSYTHKKRTNILLTEQNREISQQQEEITAQRDYLEKVLKHLKDTQSQLVESERMASLGQFTAGAAHELNNPVNFISANVKPLERDMEHLLKLIAAYDAVIGEQKLEGAFAPIKTLKEELQLDDLISEIRKLLEGLHDGAQRSAEIVRGLRSFSGLDSDSIEYCNIHQGLDAALHLLEERLGDRIRVKRNYGDIPDIECLPAKLNQVFLHLLSNSIQAIAEKGEISIATSRADSTVQISVKDSGKGMEAEVLANCFEPFFTTQKIGEGVGLGLSISYGIVKQHGGRIDARSVPGQGAEFVITLPLKQNS